MKEAQQRELALLAKLQRRASELKTRYTKMMKKIDTTTENQQKQKQIIKERRTEKVRKLTKAQTSRAEQVRVTLTRLTAESIPIKIRTKTNKERAGKPPGPASSKEQAKTRRRREVSPTPPIPPRARPAKKYVMEDSSTEEEEQQNKNNNKDQTVQREDEDTIWNDVFARNRSSDKIIPLVDLELEELNDADLRSENTSPSAEDPANTEVEGEMRPPPLVVVKCDPDRTRSASPEVILGLELDSPMDLIREIQRRTRSRWKKSKKRLINADKEQFILI